MLIKKTIETIVDIKNADDIYSKNRDTMLIDKLTNKFVGICYHSCYILKINKIIRRSYIYMKDTLDGDSQCTILFEVDAIVYIQNEIIHGCSIVKKEQNGITHAKSKYAGIQLSIPPNMAIFKENDTVPMIVKKVRYNIFQNSISILAAPFTQIQQTSIQYILTGTLSKDETADITKLLSQVTDEIVYVDSLNANDKKIYKFFNDLLSTHTNKLHTKNKLVDILQIKNGVVYKSNTFDDINIYHTQSDMKDDLDKLETDTKLSDVNIITESVYIVFYTLILEFISSIQTLREFINNYPTFAAVQHDKNIWKMYNMLKK